MKRCRYQSKNGNRDVDFKIKYGKSDGSICGRLSDGSMPLNEAIIKSTAFVVIS
jgi:hypothetical protein